jgi:hypothetical protein
MTHEFGIGGNPPSAKRFIKHRFMRLDRFFELLSFAGEQSLTPVRNGTQ